MTLNIPLSAESSAVFEAACDIALRAGQVLDSTHLLLAMYTIPCHAQAVLLEKSVQMELLLARLKDTPNENESTIDLIMSYAALHASNISAPQVSSLHLLMAITKTTSSKAVNLLTRAGISTFDLRNRAMAHSTDPRLKRAASERLAAHQQTISQQIPRKPYRRLAPRPQPIIQTKHQPDDETPIVFEALEEDFAPPPKELAEHQPKQTEQQPAKTDQQPTKSLEQCETGESDFDLDPNLFPTLTELGRNLTAEAQQGLIDPMIGRDLELDTVVDILCKRRSNNPLLLGDPGVGKTALVEGLAARIANGEARGLDNRIILSISVGDLVAGTEMRGSFAARMRSLKDEVLQTNGRVILFLDEIHTLIGTGQGDGGMDAANDLKGALARGELPCIGATTFSEYKRYILTDPALKRRFEPVTLPEPSLEEAELILTGVAPRYAAHHGISYTDDAIKTVVRLTDRVIPGRSLPAKAIDTLDLAGSRVRREGRAEVTSDDIVAVLASTTRLPASFLSLSPTDHLRQLKDNLAATIFGKSDSIDAILRVLARNWARFGTRQPLGSFLFNGPTGSGKTTFAQALAEFFFGTEKALLEIDLADYTESHSLSDLIGSPPGYEGHEDGGLLGSTIIRQPFLVIVWRNISMGHPSVQALVSQILADGSITDRLGRNIDFRNTLQIVTITQTSEDTSRPLGFGAVAQNQDSEGPIEPTDPAFTKIKKMVNPDLISSLDLFLNFKRPSTEVLKAIIQKITDKLANDFASEHGVSLYLDPQLIELCAAEIAPTTGEAVEQWVAGSISRPATDLVLAKSLQSCAIYLKSDGRSVVAEPYFPKAT
jgi:ATP-dependent Clp protease ATP-binding subunit ClpC